MNNFIEYMDSIIEISNIISTEDHIDTSISLEAFFSPKITTEIYYANSNFSPKEKEVYKVSYPFMNFNQETKFRRCIIVKMDNGKLGAMMVSSLNGKAWKSNLPYSYIIPNVDTSGNIITRYGFDKKVFAVGQTVLPINYVRLTKLTGKIDDSIYKNILKCMKIADKYKFKDPDVLREWIKRSSLTVSPQTDKVQSIYSIIASNSADNLDIANAGHLACSRCKNVIEHRILLSTFKDKNDNMYNHFYCVYRNGKKWKIFRVKPGNQTLAESYETNSANIDVAINAEVSLYESTFPGRKNDTNIIIKESELRTNWNILVLSSKSKKEFIDNIRSNYLPLYFYHMIPKLADIKKGLLAPYAASKIGDKELLAAMLDKYRYRMVNAWNYYPNRDPESLTIDELLDGLNRFRGNDGDKCIYFFRYAPYPGLGKNMAHILKSKDIYRININDSELKKHIIRIEWGWPHSNNDEKPLSKNYYVNVTKKEYFSAYNDNPKPGQPLFAPIPHIGIAFKNGICPAKFLERVSIKEMKHLNESFREMLRADTGEEIYYESLLHRATESVSSFSKDSNLFLSEDDIYCNFWDFENNRTHYCFVIGFSGSGKTNLARNLAKKYKAEWVSLDVLLYDSRVHRMTERFVSGMQKQRLLAKYLKETNTDLSYMKDVTYKETPEARRIMVETGKKFVDWLIHKNKEPVIIEGLDLIDIIPTDPSLYSAPIVFKGTSRLLSMFRRLQRSKFKAPLDVVMRMFSWYKTDAHGIDYLRSIVIGDYNYQYRPEPGEYNPAHQYRNTYN